MVFRGGGRGDGAGGANAKDARKAIQNADQAGLDNPQKMFGQFGATG